MEKVFAKLKVIPEDFIVEEIGPDWNCSVNWDNLQITEIEDKPENKDFLCFELQKRDIDHFITVKTLSKQCKKGLKFISYAGTKDKKAITSQRFSIFKPDVDLVKQFKSDFIKLSNFRWCKRKIKLGYLLGNRFKITLRDIEKRDALKIASSIKKQNSFPNFFGKQRFGSVRKNNHIIGKLLLKKEYKKVIMHILTDTSAEEKEDIKAAREKLKKEKNFKEALGFFPQNLRLERGILFSLSKKEDFLSAIKKIEKRYSLMLVQAVQSNLFNNILKRALEERIPFTEKGEQNIPLIGYKTKFSNGRLGEIEKEVLQEEELTLEDFNLREIPHLRLKGSYRKAIIEVMNISVTIEDDEQFPPSKKIILSFILPSGVYATTFLEQFFVFD